MALALQATEPLAGFMARGRSIDSIDTEMVTATSIKLLISRIGSAAHPATCQSTDLLRTENVRRTDDQVLH